jgi:hypothetical protein
MCHVITGNVIWSGSVHSTVVVCWRGLVKLILCGADSDAKLCQAVWCNVLRSCQSSRLINAAAQQALAADRFAHEIRAILARAFGPQFISLYQCGG